MSVKNKIKLMDAMDFFCYTNAFQKTAELIFSFRQICNCVLISYQNNIILNQSFTDNYFISTYNMYFRKKNPTTTMY